MKSKIEAGSGPYEALLLLTAAVWGSGFVAQRLGLDHVGPFTFNFLRFTVGTLVLLPVLIIRKVKIRPLIVPGLILGIVLTMGSNLQQIGMQYTSAGKGGFITGFYVVLVPLAGIFIGRKTSLNVWLAVLLALAGMFFMSITRDFRIEPGDTWVMASVLFWTAHILLLDRYSPRFDPFGLAAFQFAVCATINIPLSFIIEKPNIDAMLGAAPAVLWSGVLTIGLGFTLQAFAQRKAHPARASIIMSLEAVFAALFGWLFLREVLSAREFLGAALMLAAMIIAQLRFKPGPLRKKPGR